MSQCEGLTKRKKRCKNFVTNGTKFCHCHKKQDVGEIDYVQCQGVALGGGGQCKIMIRKNGEKKYCDLCRKRLCPYCKNDKFIDIGMKGCQDHCWIPLFVSQQTSLYTLEYNRAPEMEIVQCMENTFQILSAYIKSYKSEHRLTSFLTKVNNLYKKTVEYKEKLGNLLLTFFKRCLESILDEVVGFKTFYTKKNMHALEIMKKIVELFHVFDENKKQILKELFIKIITATFENMFIESKDTLIIKDAYAFIVSDGFYFNRDVFKNDPTIQNLLKRFLKTFQIFEKCEKEDVCAVCLDPCNTKPNCDCKTTHLCIPCFISWGKNSCPVCRGEIINYLPIESN